MVEVLSFVRTAPTIGAVKRIRGLTLVATDLGWSAGSGPPPAHPPRVAVRARRNNRRHTARALRRRPTTLDRSQADAIDAAPATHGFGVLTTIDVKTKLGEDVGTRLHAALDSPTAG